jgi:predicted membrane channel-forming protein YqfA (hemolysin III family)
MFSLFFWTAEYYLVISTLYYLNISHSENGEQFWLRIDLLGIIIVIKGTHISGINYLFPYELR